MKIIIVWEMLRKNVFNSKNRIQYIIIFKFHLCIYFFLEFLNFICLPKFYMSILYEVKYIIINFRIKRLKMEKSENLKRIEKI